MASFHNSGSVLNQAGRNIRIKHQHYHQTYEPDFLELGAASQAAFNAETKDDDPYCLPNTRIQILQQIRTWADGVDPKYVFWLSGWAGTGKSTVARTIAREYFDKGCFMASFFFVRGGGDVGHARKFVGTVASQLAQRCAAFESLLLKAMSKDKGLRNRTLKDQWNGLILQPLRELDAGSFQTPLLIIIDGFDECEESHIKQVLHLLSNSRHLEKLHFRVFIASRPEISVQDAFSRVPDQDHVDFVLHDDIPGSVTDGDIFTFLQHSLTEIQRKWALDEKWPGEEATRHLLRKAAGLFIWVATACRFLDQGGPMLCSDRLSNILDGDDSDIEPEEELNKIYTKVLQNSVSSHLKQHEKDKAYERLRETLGSIVTLFSQLPAPSIARLLHMQEQDVRNILGGLHSILDIPKDVTRSVRLHHPSLRDFLLSSQRCSDGNFQVYEKTAHNALAEHCIQLMSQKLDRNICCLEVPGAGDPPQNLADYFSAELQYACRYWVDHLKRSEYQLCDDDSVHCFLGNHLLHWAEALGWIKQISEGIHAIASLQFMVNSENSPNLYAFLHDAKRVLLYNRSIIEEAPLQIYSCVLAFAPQRSLVRKKFQGEKVTWIKSCPQIVEEWSSLVHTLEGHTGSVWAVVFSPEGELVASASDDKTVRLWDTVTGELIQKLEGHVDGVRAVVFTPDGKLVASASDDETVRLWDTVSGVAIQNLKGHTGGVRLIVFSSDSKLLVSVSHDRTVRLWDIATGDIIKVFKAHADYLGAATISPDGKLVATVLHNSKVRLWDTATGVVTQTLKNHTASVSAVTFSPDNKLVASVSDDKTVRLHNTVTGAAIQKLKHYIGWVGTVTFSPDSKLVALTSCDEKVWLWNIATGVAIQTLEDDTRFIGAATFSPNSKLVASESRSRTVWLWETATGAAIQILKGYTDHVYMITFSPDSKLIAASSTSNDNTVLLWDIVTGATIQKHESHTGSVRAVVFSPDSKLVVSASNDEIVRLWDTVTGTATQILKGNTGGFRSVTFSPNSKLVASASHDKTVQLWDTVTGVVTQTLKDHTDYVSAVTFSPDGKLVASASHDKTVRLWNIVTGVVTQTLKGHTGYVSTVTFSADSKLVASASQDGIVWLWNIATGIAIQTLKGHTNFISTVAFSPDSKLVASASYDATVRLWNIATGAALHIFGNFFTLNLAFSENGLYLRTSKGLLTIDNSPWGLKLKNENTLLIKDKWITFGNTKLLWLPPEYRPLCSAFQGSLIALGLSSGMVKVIEVDIPTSYDRRELSRGEAVA